MGTTKRRMGAKDSQTRQQLLDAAEQLMVEEGYAAVTSRRVGTRAGLTPQLVHYYFETMDELFLELVRRNSEAGLEAFARLVERDDLTLEALWGFQSAQPTAQLDIQLVALAAHRPSVRTELAHYGERFRKLYAGAVAKVVGSDVVSPEALTVALTAIWHLLSVEDGIGLTLGHEDTKRAVRSLLHRIDEGDEA